MALSYLRLNYSIAPFLDLNLLNLNLLDLSCSFLIIHHSRLLQDQPKQQRIQWLLNIPGGELLSIYQWLLGTLLFPIKSISKYHYFYLWKLSLDFILSVLYLFIHKRVHSLIDFGVNARKGKAEKKIKNTARSIVLFKAIIIKDKQTMIKEYLKFIKNIYIVYFIYKN